jgi:hypothetical protein
MLEMGRKTCKKMPIKNTQHIQAYYISPTLSVIKQEIFNQDNVPLLGISFNYSLQAK